MMNHDEWWPQVILYSWVCLPQINAAIISNDSISLWLPELGSSLIWLPRVVFYCDCPGGIVPWWPRCGDTPWLLVVVFYCGIAGNVKSGLLQVVFYFDCPDSVIPWLLECDDLPWLHEVVFHYDIGNVLSGLLQVVFYFDCSGEWFYLNAWVWCFTMIAPGSVLLWLPRFCLTMYCPKYWSVLFYCHG